jgi:hypothetical protein
MPKHCPTHDVASPLVIAELEAELGIDPDALTKLRSDPNVSFTDAHTDPRIIDCGRPDCQKRRRS